MIKHLIAAAALLIALLATGCSGTKNLSQARTDMPGSLSKDSTPALSRTPSQLPI